MNRKKSLVSSVLLLVLALLVPILQGCASGSYMEATPQAMDVPSAEASSSTVPG